MDSSPGDVVEWFASGDPAHLGTGSAPTRQLGGALATDNALSTDVSTVRLTTRRRSAWGSVNL